VDEIAETWIPPLDRYRRNRAQVTGLLTAISLPTGLMVRVSVYGPRLAIFEDWASTYLSGRYDSWVARSSAELGAEISFVYLAVQGDHPLKFVELAYGCYPNAPESFVTIELKDFMPQLLSKLDAPRQ
jgi:hypothetical protein